MYQYYLFDFDYTLVNSEAGIVGCFQRTLDRIGRPPAPVDDIRRTIGLPMPTAVEQILQETDPAKIEAFISLYREFANQYMTPGTFFYPESLPMLRQLQQAKNRTAVISSKTSHRIAEKVCRRTSNRSGRIHYRLQRGPELKTGSGRDSTGHAAFSSPSVGSSLYRRQHH